VTVILDAAAFVAVERGNRELLAIVKRELLAGRVPVTHGGVVGQTWRGGAGRQATLAKFLAGVEVAPLDDALARRVGVLLAQARTSDVIDAAVVLLANDADEIFTSDTSDLAVLAEAAGLQVDLVPV
jgi:hypothetical protein